MKLFKDFLKNSIEEFNDYLTDDNHFERFEKKLKKRSRNLQISVLKYAAVILPILFVLSLVFIDNSNSDKAKSISNQKYTSELIEVESYFNNKIEKQIEEFENLKCFVNESEKQQILKDLKEIDESIDYLTFEFANNVQNEKIFHAIIVNYKSKEEILDQVLNQIKENC